MFLSKKVLVVLFKFFIKESNISQILSSSSLVFKIGDHKHKDTDIHLYICQSVEWHYLLRSSH